MKKKIPPVKYNKQTQTYPLRGNIIKPKQHSSIIQGISSLPTTSNNTLLQSSSMPYSFEPKKSQLKLEQPSRIFSIPKPSIDNLQSKNDSFIMWIPKPRKFTIVKDASLMSLTSQATITDDYYYFSSQMNLPRMPMINSAISKEQQFSSTESSINSYQDSLNFFGIHAITTSSNKSLIYSEVMEESMNLENNETELTANEHSLVSENSTYSAAQAARKYSNPFYNPNGLRKFFRDSQRSVSQASGMAAAPRTRFAESPPREDSIKSMPFCGRSNCCINFSVYNPICNIPFCFPYLQLFWIFTLAFGFIGFWISLLAIWGEDAKPNGEIFQIYTLTIFAYILGWIFACFNLPPSLGMFTAGILFGNLAWIHTKSSICSAIRAIVVAFILLRTGLNIEANIFKTRGGLISRLAFIPGLSEMFVATMFGVFLLKLPWFWALLFGTIITALSPLAIIYSLVWLRENGYGENKGITSVLLMMYALDNITLVTLFGIFFTLAFDVQYAEKGKKALGFVVLRTVGTICGGISAGFLMGTFITFFPHRYDPYCGIWRTVLLSCSGLGTVLLAHILNWDGAGYLCTIVMAFTASIGWKSLGTPNYANPVNMVFAMGWHVLQPIALGLIGAEVNIAMLKRDSIKTALIVIPCCMMQTRFSLTFLMSGMTDFNYKERLFIALLSMTKGTPQAVLAPMTVNLAKEKLEAHFAQQLLEICVLEVLMTLPLGPLVAYFMGTKLLSRSENRTSHSTYFSHDSLSETDAAHRYRYRSIVSRINTDNEFMLYAETGDNLNNNETNV